MAKDEKTVNTGGEGDAPKEPENLAQYAAKNIADDLTGKLPNPDPAAPAEKGGEGLKITGITFIKGAAEDKADGVKLPEPGEVVVPSNVVDGLFDGKKKAAQEAERQAAEVKDGAEQGEQKPEKKGRGRPPKSGKDDKSGDNTDTTPKEKKTRPARPPGGKVEKSDKGAAGIGGTGAGDGNTPPVAPTPPPPPRDATRPGETETIVYINHADLYPFKDHPFQVRDDEAMRNLAASVKERGVDQPVLVRPREGGGYELVAGHRRQHASELAGLKNVPCIVRNLTDDEAILAMAESNFNQRAEILPSERAKALKMQMDAIKRQGQRGGVAEGDIGKRSVDIVAERNGMQYKTVQRYVVLNNLAPELMAFVDAGKVGAATVGYQMSFLKPKNQQYIAMALDGAAPVPTEAKVKRMRELEEKNLLNPDSIDGIMLEENKKEERKVVLNSQELDKYFSADKTPAEMKATILKALETYKEKQPLEFGKPEKKSKEQSL